MALSLKLNDPERFLLTIPRIMNLRFHPLAFAVAHGLKDEVRAKTLLGELLKQWESHWELPDINEHFQTSGLRSHRQPGDRRRAGRSTGGMVAGEYTGAT